VSIFLFRRLFWSICPAAAILAGCGGAHSLGGAPTSAIPNTVGLRGIAPAKASEQVLYSFTGGYDGGNAATGLVLDRHGNLYGTTAAGGTSLCGTIFKLTPKANPPWSETVLHNFSCYSDGKDPHGGVTFDPNGNLDGTTVAGGTGGFCASDGCGVVYSLHGLTEHVLYNFKGGNDGFGPGGGVAYDSKGNVFGTTPDGGAFSSGVVYEISRDARRFHDHVIHAFTGGKDGAVGSLGLLLRDSAGNFYGVTELGGGTPNAGTVFRISPVGTKWSFTTLYRFRGMPDASGPYGGLIADGSGNLYGTTYYGGANGIGTVFELKAIARGKYRERVLYSFKGGTDGSSPTSTLLLGSTGQLYGTTSAGGGSCDCGTIFALDPVSGKETVLHSFGGTSDGTYPYYGMVSDGSGNLYGTTVAGGSFGQGTVFKFTP
jgi:uncharacterized repeat protein (TIGR03803 family)